MNKDTNTKLTIAGVALLLCLPAVVIAAGVYAYLAPRIYYSKATLEPYHIDEPAFARAFGVASQPYGNSVELHGVRNTPLREIGVYDADPRRAAEAANQIALDLQKQFTPGKTPEAPAPEPTPAAASEAERIAAAAEARALASAQARIQAQLDQPTVRIWEKAEPAAAPARPNVPKILFLAMGAGLLPAILGIVMLIVAFASRTSQRQNPPPLAPLAHGN